MQPERWQQIEALFQSAVARSIHERTAYLQQACQGDETLRREVEALLAADQRAAEETLAMPAQVAAEMLTAPPALPPGQLLDHYQILSQLGAGGMGVVYLAEDTRLQRKVALKVLPAQFTQQSDRIRRFVQEAQTASALNHPNILTIYEIGATGATYFIATEFIEGQTLRAWLQGNHEPLAIKLDLAVQIASALAAAHAVGIIHRDIKPENVMLRPDGIVKVLDFGLAKLTGAGRGDGERGREGETSPPLPLSLSPYLSSPASTIVGTPKYMSPEQARGEKVDARTDIFSFGIVLYELLAGRMPFVGATTYETIAAILHHEPPPLALENAPTELQAIVTKALQKERDQRYPTSQELLSELAALRDEVRLTAKLRAGQNAAASINHTQPINPHPTHPSGAMRLGKLKQQKRAVFASLLVSLAAATGIGLYWRAQPTEAPIDSIAVLPFVNQNRDPNADYLADGIPEGIINSLAQLPNLKVMSRNSAFRFRGKETDAREVGQKLGVRAVLLGRVAQRDETLTISLELVDARDNRQIWGQQYNRRLAEVFAVQEEIARAISEKLRRQLTAAEQKQIAKRPTENLKAYQFYLQGEVYLQRRTHEDLLKAIRYYEKAIAEDANYALAYSGLAETYGAFVSFNLIAPQEGQRKAAEAARKAVALDDTLAQAHAVLGQTYTLVAPYDFAQAERAMRRAIELSPGAATPHAILSRMYARLGRFDVCLDEMLKAQALDPLNPSIAVNLAMIHYFRRDHKRALELLRKSHELGPALASPTEIGIFIENRLFDETLVEIAKLEQERKDNPVLLFSKGMIYAAQGKRADALQIANELEVRSGTSLTHALWVAKIYATLREPEPALTWLERGLAAGAIGMLHKDEPMWDVIRHDTRFGDLLRRMGIPQ